MIGGQVNPNVKITRQGKGIRIGQSSQVNAQTEESGAEHEKKETIETVAGKYVSVNTSS